VGEEFEVLGWGWGWVGILAALLACSTGLGVVNRGIEAELCRSRTSRLHLGQLLGNVGEEFVDVLGGLGRGFHEEDAVFSGVGLGIRGLDGALCSEVRLVASEGDHDVGAALALELLDPALCALERIHARDVVDDDGCLCSTVVHRRQTVVSFLSRRVPNLELDRRVRQADCLCEESSTDGALLKVEELALDEAENQTGLAHGGLTEEHQLELRNLVGGHLTCFVVFGVCCCW